MDRIEFEQVGQHFGTCQIIDRHEFQIISTLRGAQDVSANSSKTVDRNFDHFLAP